MSEECCSDVSEVTARHTDDEFVGLAHLLHTCISVEIVEGLGEESRHVDGVGRGE